MKEHPSTFSTAHECSSMKKAIQIPLASSFQVFARRVSSAVSAVWGYVGAELRRHPLAVTIAFLTLGTGIGFSVVSDSNRDEVGIELAAATKEFAEKHSEYEAWCHDYASPHVPGTETSTSSLENFGVKLVADFALVGQALIAIGDKDLEAIRKSKVVAKYNRLAMLDSMAASMFGHLTLMGKPKERKKYAYEVQNHLELMYKHLAIAEHYLDHIGPEDNGFEYKAELRYDIQWHKARGLAIGEVLGLRLPGSFKKFPAPKSVKRINDLELDFFVKRLQSR